MLRTHRVNKNYIFTSKNNGKRFPKVFSQKSRKSNPISATSSGFMIMMFNHRNRYFYGQMSSFHQGFFLLILKLRITQPLWRLIANFAPCLKLSRVLFLSTLAFLSLSLWFLILSTHWLGYQQNSSTFYYYCCCSYTGFISQPALFCTTKVNTMAV